MSLYTISNTNQFPAIKIPAGFRVEVCTDITLLAAMGTTTEADVINRFANGHVAFLASINSQPAAFGWMAQTKATIGELNHEFILPKGNRYLWNFRTMEAYRGLGIYPALLQYILQHAGDKANRFWIIHAPENRSSLKGIKKAGFEYIGKLYAGENGNTIIENTAQANTYRQLLQYMDIELSAQTAASCWNCSSPYLKKRKAECCCTTAGSKCTNNSMLAIAS